MLSLTVMQSLSALLVCLLAGASVVCLSALHAYKLSKVIKLDDLIILIISCCLWSVSALLYFSGFRLLGLIFPVAMLLSLIHLFLNKNEE